MIPKLISTETLREVAATNGVCIRPVVHEVIDTVTGRVKHVASPCGSTQESKCPPCARKNRILRMQQCREGWHLEQEPEKESPTVERVSEDRRVRSTRRRQDAPDLPKAPVQDRTIGNVFTSPSGRTYRPSMFVTFTLPSYGPVLADGTPRDPHSYDYRRAALDAMHFPKLIDRVWQNLRRCTGYQVQYFATIEPQRRLAPHLHAAIRGALPRETIRMVARATYHQVWWPSFDRLVHEVAPVWDGERGFVDAETGVPLPTWEQALDQLDADEVAEPAYTLRLGTQLDIQGIVSDEPDADRRVAYLTKYLAKSISEGIAAEEPTPRQRAHIARMHEEVRWLPCSPRCWNWLRYGVQPLGARAEMEPGRCPNKAHDAEHLGVGGRRVLVSRKWSGKTLQGHRADRAEVVRQTLLEAGLEAPEIDRMAADVKREDGRPRFEWKLWDTRNASEAQYRSVLSHSISERLRWKREYAEAKARAEMGSDPRAGPAYGPPRPPDTRPVFAAAGAGQG